MKQLLRPFDSARRESGPGIWAAGVVVALLVLAGSPRAAAAQGWDTNALVNEAHNLSPIELQRVRERAATGDSRSEALLGLVYEMGAAGVTADSVQALSWFNKVAAKGIPWAEVWAGDFYYTGSTGVPKDLFKALELYRSAAQHGDPKAAFVVGRMYFFGEGVTLNMAEAASWFRRALPAEPNLVGRMVALADTTCEQGLCLALRQILGAMTTETAEQFTGEWDDTAHEWEAVKELPNFARCGFTSSNKTEQGDVQNYFCDSDVIAEPVAGADAARNLAAEVEQALGAGWMRTGGTGDQANVYFFTRDGFPRVRVSYNTSPGDAPQRVTLLIGP